MRNRDASSVLLPFLVVTAGGIDGDQPNRCGTICCPMAQRKAEISRAIAVTTMVRRLPFAMSRR
jgi:hypothetical protein